MSGPTFYKTHLVVCNQNGQLILGIVIYGTFEDSVSKYNVLQCYSNPSTSIAAMARDHKQGRMVEKEFTVVNHNGQMVLLSSPVLGKSGNCIALNFTFDDQGKAAAVVLDELKYLFQFLTLQFWKEQLLIFSDNVSSLSHPDPTMTPQQQCVLQLVQSLQTDSNPTEGVIRLLVNILIAEDMKHSAVALMQRLYESYLKFISTQHLAIPASGTCDERNGDSLGHTSGETIHDQQEMLGGNLQEEGRENEGVTGGGNSPITANLKETGELSICSAHRRSREFKSLLSIMCVCVLTHTSKSRERPAHIGEISYISHDIIKLCAERITNDWFNAGVCLGMSKDELQSISESVDADTSNRNEVCCSVMLRRWLDNGDKCEKTYQKLISAEKKARGDSLLVCIEKLIDSSPPYYSGGGNSYSSQCTYDPSPPNYREIVRLSRLQSSDPYSVWEPQHECGIWDSQISAGERQEVPGMPVECPFLPSLSKTASTKQLQQSCFILGDIYTISLTHQGGTFLLYPFGRPKGVGKPECCATLEAPPGVVERGVSLYVYYAIILGGPFKLPENWKRTSVVLYIDCPNNHLLHKPIKLSLHHWAAAGSCSSMSFMKSKHFFEEGQNTFKFDHHAIFSPSKTRVANLYLKNQFCLVCTAEEEFEVGMSRYYGMLVIDPLEDGVQKFWLCLTYAVPTWIQAVKEYFRRRANSEKEPVIPEYQELELGSDDKVSLQVETMSGPGWVLSVTKKEIWLKEVDKISSYPTCKNKKAAVRCGLYPPTAHFKITYDTDPSPATHARKPNSATLSSNTDSKLHFTVYEKINSSSGVDVNPSMMYPVRASWTDSSYSNGYGDDNFQHLTATKEFTLQNLMPYLNDLADVGCQIAGWLGMEHKFSVIRIMPGVAASPRDQLQVLLTKWLEDSEQPNAPHDWEFFIRVVRGVNKGRLAERIKKEVFKDQQEMLSGNHREEGRENEGVTVPITANLKETGELSTGSALGRSRESRLSIKTSHFREGATHIGTHSSDSMLKLELEPGPKLEGIAIRNESALLVDSPSVVENTSLTIVPPSGRLPTTLGDTGEEQTMENCDIPLSQQCTEITPVLDELVMKKSCDVPIGERKPSVDGEYVVPVTATSDVQGAPFMPATGIGASYDFEVRMMIIIIVIISMIVNIFIIFCF